jgi:hypothetical protein
MGGEFMIDVATSAIMSAGMKCLKEKLGVVEAEIFITAIKEESFDYTEWRRDNLWPGMSLEEILEKAAERFPERSFDLSDRQA